MAGNDSINMDYKVLITTSGVGQRLGELTRYLNKSLIRIGKKPALSYIIESYPKEVEIVITIGYMGKQVMDFVKLVYPDRKITFIKVDKFEGAGSSLAYSMIQAKESLKCPFIYHACDTIISGKIPAPKNNWNGGSHGSSATQYASFNATKGFVAEISDKGALDFDFLHIGLVGIHDYEKFWDTLNNYYSKNPNDKTLNDVVAINQMIQDGNKFKAINFESWLDIGSSHSLQHSRDNISDKFQNLDKFNEAIYMIDNSVVKFYEDEVVVDQKILRTKELRALVPRITGRKGQFFMYAMASGRPFSETINPQNFSGFLSWCNKKLWIDKSSNLNKLEFDNSCSEFYLSKTRKRIKEFRDITSITDDIDIINGSETSLLSELLKKAEKILLEDCRPSKYHGDLVLDNIIDSKSGFKLIDWRQNFGGQIEVGDLYYDLAKLNHSLTINHSIILRDLFSVSNKTEDIVCDVLRSQNLVKCQVVFDRFINENLFDWKKIQVLTAIIWLNMAPLHHHPFNVFLYYFGKYNLWQALNLD